MQKGRLLGFGFLLLAVFVLYVDTASAACSGTDTFILRLWNPLGVNFRSSATQIIDPTGGTNCDNADSDSATLALYCQMVGRYNASIDCNSCSLHSSVANTTVLTCYAAERQKFILRNQSGGAIAAFDSKGYLYLRGFNFTYQGTLPTPKNSFVIRNNTGRDIAYIDSFGNLHLRGGISMSQSTISPPKNSLIIRNGTAQQVSYIDSTGNLVLRGKIYFNWTDPI